MKKAHPNAATRCVMMDVSPLTGSLGAEIIGADIKDDRQFEAIYQAFVDYSVITIRGQDIAPEDNLAFARRFGTRRSTTMMDIADSCTALRLRDVHYQVWINPRIVRARCQTQPIAR